MLKTNGLGAEKSLIINKIKIIWKAVDKKKIAVTLQA